jgi:hypothetical protein
MMHRHPQRSFPCETNAQSETKRFPREERVLIGSPDSQHERRDNAHTRTSKKSERDFWLGKGAIRVCGKNDSRV